jgi:hypothetical protein
MYCSLGPQLTAYNSLPNNTTPETASSYVLFAHCSLWPSNSLRISSSTFIVIQQLIDSFDIYLLHLQQSYIYFFGRSFNDAANNPHAVALSELMRGREGSSRSLALFLNLLKGLRKTTIVGIPTKIHTGHIPNTD